jgi:FKBP-type peptidyl-prolyl cis-trans isomerase FklB
MKKIPFLLPLFGAIILFTACNGTTNSQTKQGEIKLSTEMDSASYALGVNVASQVKVQGFDEMNFDAFLKAVQDVYGGSDLMISEVDAQGVLQTFFTKGVERAADKNLKEGLAFLEKNKKKSGVVTTESGLQYKIMKDAKGEKPKAEDKVMVHYHGTLIDGTVFDSSVERGEPISFALNGVIPGWTEGVQLMSVGSKYKFFIPSELAYGANQRGGGPIGPNMALIFEVELIEIVKE